MIHTWIISGLDANISLSAEDMPETSSGLFTFRILVYDENTIITTLSTTATDELNGTGISCVARSEIQIATFVFFGECKPLTSIINGLH